MKNIQLMQGHLVLLWRKSFLFKRDIKFMDKNKFRDNHSFSDYYVNDSKYKELVSCAVKKFDILISLFGTIGKVLVLSENALPGIINPRLVKISLNLDAYRPNSFKS